MADKSAFDSKNIVQTTVEQHGILEELNVPPQAIAFIRKNSRKLQIGAVCVVVAILSWTAFGSYQAAQKDASAAMLAKASQEQNEEQRKVLIEELLNKYPRTDAAIWGSVDLGHIAFQNKNFDEAISIYSSVLKKMSSDNPLVPLVQLSLAQTYESNNDMDNAIKYYQSILELPGFVAEGYQSLGRIYENQGQVEKAKEAYTQALAQENLAQGDREMLDGKLATLK